MQKFEQIPRNEETCANLSAFWHHLPHHQQQRRPDYKARRDNVGKARDADRFEADRGSLTAAAAAAEFPHPVPPASAAASAA